MQSGRPRRELLVALAREVMAPGAVVVDVGADHGYVAQVLGAIATERAEGRRGPTGARWVIADGLRPFRRVDVAIIAGMGANTIGRILATGPRPRTAAIVHAQDDPGRLRQWLASNGWRIEHERLAPEAGRYAEVIRVVPGVEPASGLDLTLGPVLLRGDDPLLAAHLTAVKAYWSALATRVAGRAPTEEARFSALAAQVERWQVARGFSL